MSFFPRNSAVLLAGELRNFILRLQKNRNEKRCLVMNGFVVPYGFYGLINREYVLFPTEQEYLEAFQEQQMKECDLRSFNDTL